MHITEANLSVAWAKAFDATLTTGQRAAAPLTVNVVGLTNDNVPEVAGIRECLDAALRSRCTQNGRTLSCRTVANTIFPASIWHRSKDRQDFYQRYQRLVPRIKRRNGANRYGLYFERMIAFDGGPENGNQLEHLIDIWTNGHVKRPSAFQVSIFDPGRDHTRQPLRGFPCLHDFALTPLGGGKLAIVANYPSQYVFERAYGNYLGLINLGQFMASQMGLELERLTCNIGIAFHANAKHLSRTDARVLSATMRQFAATPRREIALAGGADA